MVSDFNRRIYDFGQNIRSIRQDRGLSQTDLALSGISFEIKNESSHSVRVGGTDYAKGAVVKTITTDAAGIAKTGNKGLTKGQKYTMKGTLIDKTTEEAVMVDGKKVTAKETFTAEDVSGTVEISFTFPKDALKGKEVVAFETCETGGKIIAATETTLALTDTVEYKNLEPGREYTMTGQLMDKNTGKAVTVSGKEITASQTFTPKEKDGSIKLTFTVERKDLEGTTLVAFEKALTVIGDTEETVAVHEDLKDESQSVHLQKIATNAVDKGTKSHKGKVKKTVEIEDKVTYKNLVPGKKYTMTGTLMDKATGKALKDTKGKAITATKEFAPEKADGSVTISFKVSGDIVEGKTVVAFESCKYKESEVAVHADLSDKDQTVEYPKEETPDNPTDKTTSKKTTSKVTSSPKTGDTTNLALWIGILLASATGLAVTVFFLKKNRKKNRKKGY